ncbi:hypothetical protein LGM46_31170 [Burkholderia arboris]|uniref:SMODS domain-containing nucleotidyltransferase n=1 Tax=Burkholderia arboris TaxID=488730 RepID=UPI001CF1EB3D|nr:hypothetical protein [Burkholderia arboris]
MRTWREWLIAEARHVATQQQFIDFLSEIEPSPTTKSVCVSAHSKLRAKLETHETYKDIHVNTYLSGSYARVRQTDGTVRRCTLSTRAELWQRKQLRLRLLQFAANTQGSNAFDYFPVDRTNKGEVWTGQSFIDTHEPFNA